MKKNRMSIVSVIALLLAMLCACTKAENNSASEKTNAENIIRVGCEATTPGWIQTDENGKLSGYDYDVWMEIGNRIGYKIEYRIMEWDGMWAMLNDKRLDSVGEQISYTDDRAKRYYMSEPYAYNIYSLLSRKNNKALQSMQDLKTGMTISCEPNSSDEIILNAIKAEYNVELKPLYFDGMSVQEVVLGRCDLWPRAKTSCLKTIEAIDGLMILGDTNIIETNVYPFHKDEKGKELCALVSKAITEMRADGTLKKLSEKWFGMDVSVKP